MNNPKLRKIILIITISIISIWLFGSLSVAQAQTFSTTLKYGDYGEEVRRLQEILKQDTEIYPEGIVSGYFGSLTKKAVIRFQEKYASEVLRPSGLERGTGFVGSATREKLNALSRVLIYVQAKAGPDLDVTYIERTPQYDYDATKNQPAPGDIVTFTAHIVNRGEFGTGSFDYEWYIDGTKMETGTLGGISPAAEIKESLTWHWQAGNHWVKFIVDPANEIPEISEDNNMIEDRTNALAVGFWVEESLYKWFNQNQNKLGIGSNSWGDWAQRQIKKWNDIFANSTYPTQPEGVLDRVRLNKVVIVPDGALPLAGGLPTNHPDTRDKTVDLMWGFPTSGLLNTGFYDDRAGNPNLSLTDNNNFYIEYGVMHELSHARYLIDLWAFNLNPYAEMDDVKIVKLDGSKLLKKGESKFYPLQGGMMGYGAPAGREHLYSEAEVAALNRIAGRRAKCGNYNVPCNLGEYMQDIPSDNIIKVLDINNNPLEGATVNVYQSIPDPSEHLDFYDKLVDDVVDITCVTNQNGMCSVGHNPFAGTNPYGLNGVAVIQIIKGEQDFYYWLYVPEVNLAYWKGDIENATYFIRTDIAPSIITPSVPSDSLSVASDTASPVATSVDAGITNFTLLRADFMNLATTDVAILNLEITLGEWVNVGDFTHLSIYDGAILLASSSSPSSNNTFSLVWTIPRAAYKVLTVKVDIPFGTTATSVSANIPGSGVLAQDLPSGQLITATGTAQGAVMTIVPVTPPSQVGSLSVVLDPTSPAATTVNPGDSSVTLLRARFLTGIEENVSISSLGITLGGWQREGDFTNLSIYDGATLLGATSSTLIDNTFNVVWTIPRANYKILTVKVDIPLGTTATSVSARIVGLNVEAQGASSTQPIIVTGRAQGAVMTIVLVIPPPDTVPPVISSVSVTDVTSDSATITWNTDEVADSRVEYGTTSAYGNLVSLEATTTFHSIRLTNLFPATTYYFRVRSEDPSGNEAVFDGYPFTTSQASCTILYNDYFSPSFGTICGNLKYNYKADFNKDGRINITDFSIYRLNSTNTAWCQVQIDSVDDPCGVGIKGIPAPITGLENTSRALAALMNTLSDLIESLKTLLAEGKIK